MPTQATGMEAIKKFGAGQTAAPGKVGSLGGARNGWTYRRKED